MIRVVERNSQRATLFSCLFVVAMACLLPERSAAESLPEETTSKIDAIFAPWDNWESPGASVAVLREGEIVYERGYGAADLETRTAITSRTIFHVASVSKQFTDFAIVLLEQDGKLDLDDDVREYIGELPDFGKTLTLRHLGHHTSGIRDQWELLAISGTRLDDVITTDHILKLATRQRELNFDPGAEYLYSNMGFTLLAETVSRVSGKPFSEFCLERIFKPLGMTHTHFHDDHQHLVPGRAYSYDVEAGGGWRKSVLSFANAGATSLFTTVGDLARWMSNLESRTVGGDEAVETLLKKGVLNDGSEIDYALGLTHGRLRGLETLAHGGADAGFRSMLLYFPAHRLGIAVLANSPVVDPGRRASEVAEVFLGEHMEPLPSDEEAPTNNDESSAEPRAREKTNLSDEVLDRYVGSYRLEELGAVVEVSRRESSLLVEVPGQGEIEVVSLSEREFEIEQLGGTLIFAAPENGSSPSIRIRIPGQELIAERFEPMSDLDLSAYAGWYFSPELETFYRISSDGDGLLAQHVRNDDIRLVPVTEDEFQGDQWFFGVVRFERGEEDRVEGFRLSGGRVRDLLFRRIDGAPLGLR